MARRLIGWQGSSGGVWPGGSAFCVGTMAIIAGPASLLSPLRHSLPSVYRWPQHCHLSGMAILLSSYYHPTIRSSIKSFLQLIKILLYRDSISLFMIRWQATAESVDALGPANDGGAYTRLGTGNPWGMHVGMCVGITAGMQVGMPCTSAWACVRTSVYGTCSDMCVRHVCGTDATPGRWRQPILV